MSAANSTPLRDRVAFEVNVPQTVTPEGAGTEQASRDGRTEYRYFLQGHQIMWVPQEVHDAIEAAQAPYGDSFEICRVKRGRAATTWETIHLSDEPADAPAPPPAPAPAPRLTSRPRTSKPPARPAPTPEANEPLSVPAPRQERIPEPDADCTTMYSALCASVRIAAEVEKYAAQLGHPVSFGTGDIRAMAASMYIHATEGR